MRRFVCLSFLIALFLAAPILCAGCQLPTSRNDFAYAAAPFSATVRGIFLPPDDPAGTPRPVAATVTVGAPDPETGGREMTVTFTAPASLAGVTVTAVHRGETRAVTFTYPTPYGTVTSTSATGDYDGFLRFAEALLPIGDVAEISAVDENGVCTVTRRTADGKREAVFTFSPEQALPLRVTVTDGYGVTELMISG